MTSHPKQLDRAEQRGRPAHATQREQQLIEQFDRYVSGEDNICFFAVSLIRDEYDPSALAKLARQRHQAQRLGYLAEVCAETTRTMHLDDVSGKLIQLFGALEDAYSDWQYLNPMTPEWGKRWIRTRTEQGDLHRPISERWKIYSPLDVNEMEDFIDLYVTKDYARYTPQERYEMQEKGVKYTRMERK